VGEGDPRKDYEKGRLTFTLHGEKLGGAWHLVRMRSRPGERRENWLLIKSEDACARPAGAPDILEEEPLSVATGRTLEEIAAGKLLGPKVWSSKRPAKPKAAAAKRKPAKPRAPRRAARTG
jgi:bifunctional non-homologous end joining protein LigD